MYGQGHPSHQHFIPHVAHMSQPYSTQNFSNDHYYESGPAPTISYPVSSQQREEKIRSTSSVASVVEVHHSDSDYEPEVDGGGKRCKIVKSNQEDDHTDMSNPMKVGRHQDKIRALFKYENGVWLCPICSRSVSPRAGRMKTHFEKCQMLVEYKIAKELDSVAGPGTCPEPNSPRSDESSSNESASQSSVNHFKPTPRPPVKKKNKTGRSHGGRLKSDVWTHYEERDGLFYCKRCSKRVSSKAHRLTQHLATSCINSPPFISAELRKVGLRASNDGTLKESQDIRQQFDLRNGKWYCIKCQKVVNSSIIKMKKHLEMWCGTMSSNIVRGASGLSDVPTSTSSVIHSKKMNSMMNTQLGKFIFRSNLSFNVVEDPEFIQFVSMLRSSFTPPTVADVGDSILTEVQKEIQQKMTKEIENKSVTLIQYGWSKISEIKGDNSTEGHTQNHLIIHCLHNGKSSFFLNATEISAQDTTPQMVPTTCLKLLDSSMESATKLYNCKLIGVLTDTAVRADIQQFRPNVHVYGCYKDQFDVLGKELAQPDLINTVCRVQEYFDNIAALDGVHIVVSNHNDKDWKSQLKSLQSFITNNEKYREVSTTFLVPEDVKAILEDQDLCKKVEQLLIVLTQLAEALKNIKHDTSIIADAVNAWLDLMKHEHISTEHKEKIKDIFVLTPMAIAAYLLHPVYRGESMDLELQEVGRLWLLEKDPMFVVFQSALERGDASYFPSSLLNTIVAKQMAPAVWWDNAGKWPKIPAGLAEIAVSLMILPASNMVSEFFPTIVEMVSSQKKSLGWEKTLQLCNAYFDLQRK